MTLSTFDWEGEMSRNIIYPLKAIKWFLIVCFGLFYSCSNSDISGVYDGEISFTNLPKYFPESIQKTRTIYVSVTLNQDKQKVGGTVTIRGFLGVEEITLLC